MWQCVTRDDVMWQMPRCTALATSLVRFRLTAPPAEGIICLDPDTAIYCWISRSREWSWKCRIVAASLVLPFSVTEQSNHYFHWLMVSRRRPEKLRCIDWWSAKVSLNLLFGQKRRRADETSAAARRSYIFGGGGATIISAAAARPAYGSILSSSETNSLLRPW